MHATRVLILSLLTIVASLPTDARGVEKDVKPVDLRVLGTENPTPGEMLHRYLLDQTGKAFEARRQAITAIKTPEDIAARQKTMRAFFLHAIGDLPQRTPLNAQVVGTLHRDGYRVEKVIFESRPKHHVTASLYLPDGEPTFPGVLVPCGHSDEGKAYAQYQRMAIFLARNGMAALCYDPIGQGERYQRLDAEGKPVIRGTTEHTMAGIGALLVGREEAGYRIWDGMRALDYLESRPEIDRHRLGCTGNSGGGTMTAYLMALDDRIAVAAPSCYITSLERLFATIGPQDAEQDITGQVAVGMEHADYITMRAPKPTLLCVGTRDFFDIQGSWNTFREVKLIYGRLGFGERVDLFESDETHGFTRPRRIAALRWMARWLQKRVEDLDESEPSPESVADLRCTKTGQVLRDLPGERSVFDLNAARADELRDARTSANDKRTDAEFRAIVRKRIGLEGRPIDPARLRVVGTVETRGRTIRKLIFETEPGILVPALDIAALESARNAPTVVKISIDGSRALEERSATPGRTVILQPRGMGETAPSAKGLHGPFGNDWKEAFLAFHLNRPLLGQRVFDVLAAVEALHAERPDDLAIHLLGAGIGGPIALHAALLDENGRIAEITLERSLKSWDDLVHQGISHDQLSSVVPGALIDYDLPDIIKELAPRPVHTKPEP